MDLIGFDVFRVDAVVADVGIGKGDDLLAVARVCQDFLVAGHGRVEHDLSDGRANRSNGISNKHRAVCERQNGCGGGSLERQKHWVLRIVNGYAQANQSHL